MYYPSFQKFCVYWVQTTFLVQCSSHWPSVFRIRLHQWCQWSKANKKESMKLAQQAIVKVCSGLSEMPFVDHRWSLQHSEFESWRDGLIPCDTLDRWQFEQPLSRLIGSIWIYWIYMDLLGSMVPRWINELLVDRSSIDSLQGDPGEGHGTARRRWRVSLEGLRLHRLQGTAIGSHRQPLSGLISLRLLRLDLFGLTFIYFIYFWGFSRIAMQRPLCRIMTLQWEHWSFWMTIRCLAYSGLEVLIPLISVFLCVQAETVNKGRSLVATADPLWSLLLKTSESTALRVSSKSVGSSLGCWPLSCLGWGCRRKRNSILVWHAQTFWLFHCIAQIWCIGYVLISLC